MPDVEYTTILPFRALPPWAKEAVRDALSTRPALLPFIKQVHVYVGTRFRLPGPAYDWSVVYYYARAADGRIIRLYVGPYESMISATPLERALAAGGEVSLKPGEAILRVELLGRNDVEVRLYAHPTTAPGLPEPEHLPEIPEDARAYLTVVQRYIPRARPEYWLRVYKELKPGPMTRQGFMEWLERTRRYLTELGFLDARGAITLKGKRFLMQKGAYDI